MYGSRHCFAAPLGTLYAHSSKGFKISLYLAINNARSVFYLCNIGHIYLQPRQLYHTIVFCTILFGQIFEFYSVKFVDFIRTDFTISFGRISKGRSREWQNLLQSRAKFRPKYDTILFSSKNRLVQTHRSMIIPQSEILQGVKSKQKGTRCRVPSF